MSGNEDSLGTIIGGGGGDTGDESVGPNDPRNIQSIQPTITDEEGREVTPVYVETLRKVAENDNATHRTLCGETQVEAIGERDLSVTIEGILLLDQLSTLREMRPATNALTVIDDEGTHRNINFSRLTTEQKDELNKGRYRLNGVPVTQPAFEFQLQTVDDQQDQ